MNGGRVQESLQTYYAVVSVSIICHEITYAVIEAAISGSIAFLDVVNVSLDGKYEYRCKMHSQKCEEAEEVAVVDYAHAIVQPRTVVVPPLRASVADITMLRPRRLDNKTRRAKLNRINKLQQFLKS